MDLLELRREIDHLDEELVSLFSQRMEIAARIADYKKEEVRKLKEVLLRN